MSVQHQCPLNLIETQSLISIELNAGRSVANSLINCCSASTNVSTLSKSEGLVNSASFCLISNSWATSLATILYELESVRLSRQEETKLTTDARLAAELPNKL